MATVIRVLRWRRNSQPPAEEIAPLVGAFRAHHPKASSVMITRAYDLAADAHRQQIRKSGESYIHHPLAVARIVAELGLDDITIAAALLHDAVEDTHITLDDVTAEFGPDVAGIVDGVTKLERVRFDSKEAQQAATMRKMLVAMAKDARVLIIKLSDRLHNMSTLAGLPAGKQERIARETIDIYAPLAHRLGMQEMRQHLEDLAFATLHPTVVGPGGKTVEVQIRTREMHQRAEFGVAAHYSYKGDDSSSDMPWLNRIIDWQQETSDPSAFMETLRIDLDQDEVYVFTPKGRVVTMPNGATPIDFAYSIHTEVGHACIGARLNGRLVPLDSKLSSGDTVEIFTSKVEGAGPSRDWLQIVASPRGANNIRQ